MTYHSVPTCVVLGVVWLAAAGGVAAPPANVVEFETTEAMSKISEMSKTPIKLDGLTLSFVNGAIGGVADRGTSGYKGSHGNGIAGDRDRACVLRVNAEGVVQFAFDTPVSAEGFGFEYGGIGDERKKFRLTFMLNDEVVHTVELTGPVPGRGLTFSLESDADFTFDTLQITKASRYDTEWSIDRITFREAKP